MFIYKSLNPSETKLFQSTTKLKEVPEGFAEASMVYHVRKTRSKTDFDYQVDSNGSILRFKFTSEAGRTAQKRGGMIPKTFNKDAVTCPGCRDVLGLKTYDLMEEVARLEKEADEKEAQLLIEENEARQNEEVI